MSAREELARTIGAGLDGWWDFDGASADWQNEMLSAADAVIAAGWLPQEQVAEQEPNLRAANAHLHGRVAELEAELRLANNAARAWERLYISLSDRVGP